MRTLIVEAAVRLIVLLLKVLALLLRRAALTVDVRYDKTQLSPNMELAFLLADGIARRRWGVGNSKLYGDRFITSAGIGRHSVDSILEHAIAHSVKLYLGYPDDVSEDAIEHIGAVLWAYQALSLYYFCFPEVFREIARVSYLQPR